MAQVPDENFSPTYRSLETRNIGPFLETDDSDEMYVESPVTQLSRNFSGTNLLSASRNPVGVSFNPTGIDAMLETTPVCSKETGSMKPPKTEKPGPSMKSLNFSESPEAMEEEMPYVPPINASSKPGFFGSACSSSEIGPKGKRKFFGPGGLLAGFSPSRLKVGSPKSKKARKSDVDESTKENMTSTNETMTMQSSTTLGNRAALAVTQNPVCSVLSTVDMTPTKRQIESPTKATANSMTFSAVDIASPSDGFSELLTEEDSNSLPASFYPSTAKPANIKTLLLAPLSSMENTSMAPVIKKTSSSRESSLSSSKNPKILRRSISDQTASSSKRRNRGLNFGSDDSPYTPSNQENFRQPLPQLGQFSLRNLQSSSCLQSVKEEGEESTEDSDEEGSPPLKPKVPKRKLLPLGASRSESSLIGRKRNAVENERIINRALKRSDSKPNLIADCSRPYCLPILPAGVKHPELKRISPETLHRLIQGQFSRAISRYTVIDCRFPYEFDGGHIQGAVNIYTREQILKEILPNEPCMGPCPVRSLSTSSSSSDEGSPEEKDARGAKKDRNILIFHCEFSSERAPALLSYLRNMDRRINEENYPILHFPELYLLDGGYKSFFESYPDQCVPSSYRTMIDPNFGDEYRRCKAEAKTHLSGNTTIRRSDRRTPSVRKIVANP